MAGAAVVLPWRREVELGVARVPRGGATGEKLRVHVARMVLDATHVFLDGFFSRVRGRDGPPLFPAKDQWGKFS